MRRLKEKARFIPHTVEGHGKQHQFIHGKIMKVNFYIICMCFIVFLIIMIPLTALMAVIGVKEPVIGLIRWFWQGQTLAAIAAIASAFAALMSFRVTQQSVKVAEEANFLSMVPHRTNVMVALRIVWNFLNRKCCCHRDDPNDPDLFRITKDELKILTDREGEFLYESTVFNKQLHKDLKENYRAWLKMLEGQQKGDVMSAENRLGWMFSSDYADDCFSAREEARDEALELLNRVEHELSKKSD
jgi:hypothetical protein